MMIVNEEKLHKIVHGILREMRNASYSNYEYIVTMLKQGYIAHGTSKDNLTVFDKEYIKGGCRGEFGYGFYFTDELYKCLEYGSNIYFTPKSIYNFLDLDEKSVFDDIIYNYNKIYQEIHYCEEKLYTVRNNREYEYYSKEIERLKSKVNYKNEFFMSLMEKGKKQYNNSEQIYKHILNNIPPNMFDQVSSLLLDYGYDGICCGNQYCIFNFEKLNANIFE